jgi:hypothetical protein
LAALLVLSLVAGACHSGKGHPASKSPTTTTLTSTSTTDPQGAAALASYRAFWTDFISAGDPPDPTSARLREHATGEELQHVVSGLLSSKAAGEVLRGTIDLAPVVVSANGDTVTIRDCYANHILAYEAKSGEPKGAGRQDRSLVTVTMVLDAGVFKVSNLTHERDGCLTAT